MSEFRPVSTKSDLECLDEDEMVSGYRDGLNGGSEPGSDKSRSYWHGWRNGMTDKGFNPGDEAQASLAQELYGPARRMGMN
jgi:ribosome modulation factor